MDGFVYGAICGLGFAIVEDVFYFMAVFGGQPGGGAAGLLGAGRGERSLRARALHGARRHGDRRRRLPPATEPLAAPALVAAGLLRVAVLAHFLWNSPLLALFPRRPWTGATTCSCPARHRREGAAAARCSWRSRCASPAGASAGGSQAPWRSEVGLDGISPSELRPAREPPAPRAAGARCAARAGARGRGCCSGSSESR